MTRLRKYKPHDAQLIISWIKDETAFRNWCADRYQTYPITADDMNRQYEMSDPERFFPMTAVDETGVVGHLIMRYTDENKSTVRFGFIIIDNNKRGQGIGKQMITAGVRYAFDVLYADKITLGVFENNLPAYRCYRAVGFCDSQTVGDKYYHILDEEWKCIELELQRKT